MMDQMFYKRLTKTVIRGLALAAGGRTLMVCDGRAILESGYFEVFKKYCGK